jgi:hypothetical protein
MGRTIPTFRYLIESFGIEWNDFKRVLKDIDKEAFEELLNHARKHGAAGSNIAIPNPFEPIVISILIEHEKTIRILKEKIDKSDNLEFKVAKDLLCIFLKF